jgi:hypothetical protein
MWNHMREELLYCMHCYTIMFYCVQLMSQRMQLGTRGHIMLQAAAVEPLSLSESVSVASSPRFQPSTDLPVPRFRINRAMLLNNVSDNKTRSAHRRTVRQHLSVPCYEGVKRDLLSDFTECEKTAEQHNRHVIPLLHNPNHPDTLIAALTISRYCS